MTRSGRRLPIVALGFLSAVVFFVQLAHAATVAIDFESIPGPDGEYGTTDDESAPTCGPGPFSICSFRSSLYSSHQITFSSGTPFQGAFFPGSDSSNHYISSTPLIASLSVPVNEISVTSYSFWTAVLWAFDASDNVIASGILINPAPGPGGSALLGTLRV